MRIRAINFDMDGTLVDFYNYPDWLSLLRNFNSEPYENAKPLVPLNVLTRYLHKAQDLGYQVNVISWLSKEPDPDYDTAVTRAKKNWLKDHLPSVTFNNIYIVPYGTPKETIAAGILFDDEIENREKWNATREENHAYDEDSIFQVLKLIAAGEL